MKERLQALLNTRIMVETTTHHIGYAHHKGILIRVQEDYIELDCGNKGVIIPIYQIITVTMK